MSQSRHAGVAASYFTVGLLVGIFLCAVLFAWLGQRSRGTTAGQGRVLSIAHSLPENHPVHQGLLELARKAEELSGGELSFTLFPNGQLGSEAQCLEKVQTGSLDITKVSAAPVSNFVTSYKLFSLPYLFRDEEHYWQVLDGEIGAEMLTALTTRGDGSPSGLHGLGYMDSGSRSFYTVEPLKGLEDLRGRKLRVMNDAVAMDMVESMGGSPTPIAFGELYTALKQGVVDGAENNPPSFLTSGHHEVCKHYLLDHHARIPDVILISSKVWDGLNARQRGWLQEAIDHAARYQRDLWATETRECLKQLKAHGVTIIEPDPAAFVEASKPVHAKHSKGKIGELVRRIGEVE